VTLSEELRTYDATNNATGAHAMMRKAADVVDEMSACLRLLTEKGIKQSTGLSWSKRLQMARNALARARGEA
jgi:hypothetical protein